MIPLLILPTDNEAPTIVEVIARSLDVVPGIEVLVVDNVSTDGTPELVTAYADESARDRVHLLERSTRQGLGTAYQEGFRWALERRFDVVIQMDSDLQHDPGQLPLLLDGIAAGADLAIGSRYVEGGTVPTWSLHRRVLSRGANLVAETLLRLPVLDATSGLRAYRSNLLRRIELADVASEGFGFQVEMVFRCHRSGANLVEVPIAFAEREQGHSKLTPRIVLEAVLLVLRLSPEALTHSQTGKTASDE